MQTNHKFQSRSETDTLASSFDAGERKPASRRQSRCSPPGYDGDPTGRRLSGKRRPMRSLESGVAGPSSAADGDACGNGDAGGDSDVGAATRIDARGPCRAATRTTRSAREGRRLAARRAGVERVLVAASPSPIRYPTPPAVPPKDTTFQSRTPSAPTITSRARLSGASGLHLSRRATYVSQDLPRQAAIHLRQHGPVPRRTARLVWSPQRARSGLGAST